MFFILQKIVAFQVSASHNETINLIALPFTGILLCLLMIIERIYAASKNQLRGQSKRVNSDSNSFFKFATKYLISSFYFWNHTPMGIIFYRVITQIFCVTRDLRREEDREFRLIGLSWSKVIVLFTLFVQLIIIIKLHFTGKSRNSFICEKYKKCDK